MESSGWLPDAGWCEALGDGVWGALLETWEEKEGFPCDLKGRVGGDFQGAERHYQVPFLRGSLDSVHKMDEIENMPTGHLWALGGEKAELLG